MSDSTDWYFDHFDLLFYSRSQFRLKNERDKEWKEGKGFRDDSAKPKMRPFWACSIYFEGTGR